MINPPFITRAAIARSRYALRVLWCIALALVCLTMTMSSTQAAAQEQLSGLIYQVDVEGVVTEVTVNYLRRALRQAEASNATALIIQLGSEGAVLRAVRPFANELTQAKVPVVVYVAPARTDAGAAGAFLLSAAHIAAMAPETSFGSPTPLADIETLLTAQTQELFLDEVSQQLRAWNKAQGRNTDWVDRAVREGVLLSNEQAIAVNPPAINFVARDNSELLTLLEGRIVRLENGQELRLSTLGRSATAIPPTLWEQFLLLLANPTVAFLLLVMGAIAIYAELITPSVGVLAGLGVVLLLGALAGLLVLPIRWLSLLGILLAFGIIGADLFVPSHGALTVVGLALLVVSALTLIDSAQAPGAVVALWAVVVVALGVMTFVGLGILLIMRTRHRPVATGQEGMIGRLAEVRTRLEPAGMVFVEGALWQAVSEDGDVEPGDWVRITAIYDLHLVVRRVESERSTAS